MERFQVVFVTLCIRMSLAFRSYVDLRTTPEENMQSGTYRVLSYNLCWGCMEADTRDKTGMKNDLGIKCAKQTRMSSPTKETVRGNSIGTRVSVCAANMGESIANWWNHVGGYDFMGFQEASNFRHLNLPNRGVHVGSYQYGTRMKGLHFGRGTSFSKRTKRAWIVTAWNKAKFGNYSAVAKGTSPCDPGRPFLVLAFDTINVLFINVHNTQPSTHRKCWKNFLLSIHTKLAEKMFVEKPERKLYRVIMVGDFNDRYGSLPGLKLPWFDAKLETSQPLAQTCCETRLGKDPFAPGDYIFDSASTPENLIPELYDNSIPQSDHRPVEAMLVAPSGRALDDGEEVSPGGNADDTQPTRSSKRVKSRRHEKLYRLFTTDATVSNLAGATDLVPTNFSAEAKCDKDTGGTCRVIGHTIVIDCFRFRKATCNLNAQANSSHGLIPKTSRRCMCGEGYCALGGFCVKATSPDSERHVKRLTGKPE